MANIQGQPAELNLENIDDSIFNIQCGRYLWEVPGSILASNSDLLRFARSRGFLETKLIDLSEHDPTNIARMLQWIYLEKYDMDNTEWFNHDGITTAIHLPMFEHQAAWEQLLWEDRGRAIMEIHADVYIFADKLGIKGLKSLALVYVDEAHSLRLDPGQFVYYFECFPRSLTEDPLLLSHLVELAIKCFPVEDGKLTDPYMMRLLDRNNKFVHLLCATLVSRLRASATS